jgi:hypothetical protein
VVAPTQIDERLYHLSLLKNMFGLGAPTADGARGGLAQRARHKTEPVGSKN